MALTQQELQGVLEHAARAKAGDPLALRFFDELRKQGTQRAKEFLNAYENYEAEQESGVALDPSFVQSLNLSPQQVKDCKEVTYRYAKGDAQAITFFNGCERGRDAGSPSSSGMLTLRDAILSTLGKGGDSTGTVSKGAPPSLSAFGVAPHPAALPKAGMTNAQAQVDTINARLAKTGALPAGNLVTTMPPLTRQGIALLREAIARRAAFTADSFALLLDAYEALAFPIEAPPKVVVAPAQALPASPVSPPSPPSPPNGHA